MGNKLSKKMMGMALSAATVLSTFSPLTVIALDAYDVNITFADGYTAVEEGDKLAVYNAEDTNKEHPNYTELHAVEGNAVVGTASCTSDTSCKIHVESGVTTKINTNLGVFEGESSFNLDNEIAGTKTFTLKNQAPVVNNLVVHLDSATISGNKITFSADNKTFEVTISTSMGATYTVNGVNIEISEQDRNNVKFGLPANFDRNNYEVYALAGETTTVVNLSGDNDFSTSGFTGEIHLGIRKKQNNNQPEDPNHGPEPGESQFDGKAYLIWSCKNGGICMKHFDNIPNYDDGNSTFYKDTDIKDERTGETFNINAKYKGWSTDDKFNNWVEAYKKYHNIPEDQNIDWSKVDPKDMLGDPIDVRPYEDDAIKDGVCTKNEPQDVFEACVNNYAATKGAWVPRAQLQPVGEPSDNNGYVSYGDRNFKVVVYNSKYKGITIGDLSDLEYYPAQWANPFIRQDQFDISGTTKDEPTYVNAVLLEKTLNIKTLDYNGFEIDKIEALDVPSDAVSINKVDGEWKLVFSSNFYDNVVFKVTDTKGEISYFAVKRTTIDAWVNNVEGKPHYYAEVYYDKRNKYTDFDVTAKITYKDGTTENVKLTPYNRIDDGLGNITKAYEVDESVSSDPRVPTGKGLKKAVFIYELPEGKTDRDIKVAYTNIEFKGSTSDKYAGAFAGSGKGVKANIYQGEEE